jgi:hypothetical protein
MPEPSPEPPLAPTLAPTTLSPTHEPAPPTTIDCSEPPQDEELIFTINGSRYGGTCEAYAWNKFCSEEAVKEACPVSCRVCVPAGCEENPDFDCEAWKGWKCWDAVKSQCKLTCGEPGCAR